MNLIQKEWKAAKKNMLTLISGTDLVELSRENVAKVEAMIRNNSDYIQSSDRSAGPTKKSHGSTAYWMTMLKKELIDKKGVHLKDIEDIIANAIEAVDRENSTHLNADGVGRNEMRRRIVKGFTAKEFLNCLKNPNKTKLKLIKRLAAKTHPKDKKHKPRTNVSFASKFCHYSCFYLFEGKKEQDNYSIYDNVLMKALPKYIEHYKINIKEKDLKDYATYRKAVDKVINKAGKQISRNGFDHLLWYYFKGRLYKL